MAHMISVRKDGYAEMAFAGETPWHSLGQRVQEGASIEEWQKQAGLDWAIERSIVRFQTTGDGDASIMRAFPDRMVLSRSDTHDPLSVVSDGYQVVQPKRVLEFFRDLCAAHGFKIHTAGVLNGGRRIWVMARNGHTEEAAAGDKLRGNLLLATSCDGTMNTTALWTAVRVVCANTLRIAVNGGKDAIRVSHRSQFNEQEVKNELGALDTSFAELARNAQELARKTISEAQAKSMLQTLFNKPVRLAAGARTVIHADSLASTFQTAQMGPGSDLATLLVQPIGGVKQDAPADARAVAKVMALYSGAGMGATHAGSAGTAWGLVNAVSQYVDHDAGRTADTRMQSAWFGKGADVKDQAMTLALAL